MAGPQPDEKKEIQDLRQWIQGQFRQSYDISAHGAISSEKRFLPIRTAEDAFQGGSRPFGTQTLKALWSDSHDVSGLAHDVAESCSRVFCILLLIGQARFIETFVLHPELYDDRLPFDEDAPPRHFPTDSSNANFFKRFCEEQWKFCAPRLHKRMGVEFGESLILPFLYLEQKGAGNTSRVYRAVVHRKHDDLKPKGSENQAYAIKTYTKRSALKNFQKECAAFKRITESGARQTPGIVEFYASFVYNGSFNLVLEYADQGTLEDIFKRQPPSDGKTILAFWQNLFEVIKGVFWIHDHHLPPEKSNEILVEQGWHQDLKPENILVFSSDDEASLEGLRFKIADLGLYHVEKVVGIDSDAAAVSGFGTRTYGAPECYGYSNYTEFNRHNKVKRGVDIWSLGCIFSETVTWLVRENAGLLQYREERATETGRIANFRGGDCFHDGSKKLQIVENYHVQLRRDLHSDDKITGRVLDMVDDMLNENPKFRPRAEFLDGKAETAVSRAQNSLNAVTTPEIRPSIPVGPSNLFHTLKAEEPGPSKPINRGVILDDFGLFSSPTSTGILDDPGPSLSNSQPPPSTPTHKPLPLWLRMAQSGVNPMENGKAPMQVGLEQHQRQVSGTHSIGSTHRTSDPITPTLFSVQPGPSRASEVLLECPQGCGMHMKQEMLEDHQKACKGPALHLNESGGSSKSNPEASIPHAPANDGVPEGPKVRIPHCSVAQLKTYYDKRKRHDKTAWLPDHGLLEELEDRDHVFIIDDSETMEAHWTRVRDLARLLAYLVKHFDKNGLDLLFLSSPKYHKCKTSTKVFDIIDKHKARTWTNLDARLNHDLAEYGLEIDKRLKNGIPSKRSIYLFTDGILRGGEANQGQFAIKSIVDKLLGANLGKGQVGIQLISFGNDPAGISRLENLDQFNPGLDIVDTEPSTANVWKMLLGSINEIFDGDPTPIHASATFP